MRLPRPEPGLIISYSYLWHREHRKGMEEGRKDRPCLIVLVLYAPPRGTRVTVVPITHLPPTAGDGAVELPAKVKAAIGLDNQPSWIIIDEVNQFDWPGFDVRPTSGAARPAYGFIPPRLYDGVLAALRAQIARRKLLVVPRD